MNKPNPVGWRGTPLTVGLAVVAMGAAIWVMQATRSGQEVLAKTAKDAAVQAVRMHSAPPVKQVHPDAVSSPDLELRLGKIERIRDEKFHAVDRKLDKIDSKLDALVRPDTRRAGGRAYTRRLR